jgi:hypothetical protein
VLLLFYLEPTSFGISTHIWRRCWATWQVRIKFIVEINILLASYVAVAAYSHLKLLIAYYGKNQIFNIFTFYFHLFPHINSGYIVGARQVFERWMEWEPDEQAWLTYIKFELRYKEIDRARAIYNKFVMVHPDIPNWIKFARYI